MSDARYQIFMYTEMNKKKKKGIFGHGKALQAIEFKPISETIIIKLMKNSLLFVFAFILIPFQFYYSIFFFCLYV